mgnify:CR=1 FL=1
MAFTATESANADGKGIYPSHQVFTLAGQVNGVTPVEATIVARQPVKGGSLFVALSGGIDTHIVTVTVRPAAVPAASLTANNIVFTGTMTTGTDGTSGTAYKVFAFPASALTLAPGNYVLRMVVDVADAASVAGTLTLVSLN